MTQGKLDFGLSAHCRRLLDRLAALLANEPPCGAGTWLLLAILEELYLATGKGTAVRVATTQRIIRNRILARLRASKANRQRLGLRQMTTAMGILKKRFRFVSIQEQKSRLKSLPAIYWLEWPAIESFVVAGGSKPAGKDSDLQSAVLAATERSFLRVETENCAPDLDPTFKEDPSPSNWSAVRPPDNWREVEESLVEAGIGNWSHLVDIVAANGCAPSEILEILRHAAARPGAWGPGAVHHRIKSQLPGRPVGEFWPQPNAAYERAERQRVERERRTAEIEIRGPVGMAKANYQSGQKDRDARYGATLDAMSKADVDALADRLPEFGASSIGSKDRIQFAMSC